MFDTLKKSPLFAILLGMLFSFNATAYSIELSKDDLQQQVSLYFPLVQATPLSKLTYSNPVVILNPNTNRIGLEVTIRIEVPGMLPVEGRGQIDGNLEYRQQTQQFYLHDPKLTNVRLANSSYELAGAVQQIVTNISQQSLPLILVYDLKDDDLRQKMVKSVMKSVTVKEGKVYLDLELP